MLRHITDADGLHGSEGGIGLLHLRGIAQSRVVANPVTEIMYARGIAVALAVPIALLMQLTDELAKAFLSPTGTEREGCHHIDIGGAVELDRIQHQAFIVGIELERMSYVGAAEELTGVVEHVGLSTGQQLLHEHAVLRRVVTTWSLRGYATKRQLKNDKR